MRLACDDLRHKVIDFLAHQRNCGVIRTDFNGRGHKTHLRTKAMVQEPKPRTKALVQRKTLNVPTKRTNGDPT